MLKYFKVNKTWPLQTTARLIDIRCNISFLPLQLEDRSKSYFENIGDWAWLSEDAALATICAYKQHIFNG